MRSSVRACLRSAWLAFAVGLPISAQQPIAPPLLAVADGAVYLNGAAVTPGRPLLTIAEKDVMRTALGHLLAGLDPNVQLRMDAFSSVRLAGSRPFKSTLDLTEGTAVLHLWRSSSVTVMCGSTSVLLRKPGLYRVDADPARVWVFAGQAQVEEGGRRLKVDEGESATLDGTLAKNDFDREAIDALGFLPGAWAKHPSWLRPGVGSEGRPMSMTGTATGGVTSVFGYGLRTRVPSPSTSNTSN